MSIDAKHAGYTDSAEKWKLIDDICDGENVTEYLIELNPTDHSPENRKRNEAYKKRAVFYAIAGYTSRGLNGLLFSHWPEFNVPQRLDYLATNADGAGNSIYQQAQLLSKDVIRNGRAGLAVTFPQTQGGVSQADLDGMRAFATLHHIAPGQIINWRTITVGAQTKLSLVVLAETKEVIQEDGYSVKYEPIRRELALDADGLYIEREWVKVREVADEWRVEATYIPTDGAGNRWDTIPFTFVGAENNDPTIDHPPMYDLARVNLGHYRNSADYEDSVWYAGQAQPWMSGVNQTHLDMMKNANMYVGSRSLLGVPSGEQFGFAAAPPNPLVKQAMDDKLDLMIGMGARFIQPSGPARTASEVEGDRKVQHSALSLISSNVSEAYVQGLEWAGRYMNADASNSVFDLNREFILGNATAQEIQAVWATYMGGGIPLSDWVEYAKRQGLIDPEKSLERVTNELGTSMGFDLSSG